MISILCDIFEIIFNIINEIRGSRLSLMALMTSELVFSLLFSCYYLLLHGSFSLFILIVKILSFVSAKGLYDIQNFRVRCLHLAAMSKLSILSINRRWCYIIFLCLFVRRVGCLQRFFFSLNGSSFFLEFGGGGVSLQ